ncbi:uncharacterized protein DUF4224 [Ralstonia sp. 151470066-2]|jgi:hypothetical protein|nr:DUF4224 domain-containing protein [Ralstonia insidiosa]MCK8648830.1 DUF4224 domain-containing protein [Ralstonia insidiosa]UNJ99644.1 DUF4224 domain-containing protein [Ralstonia insidiosa]
MTETAARIIETTCRNWKMFLTANELERLTGRKRSDAQDRALNSMGIEHIKRADGRILVAREHVEHLLGVKQETRRVRERELDRSLM